MKRVIPFVAIFIGFVGLVASCIYMENPWGIDELYYGYPFLWLNTSKSLLFSFPPIPSKVNILWVGFILDMLLYSSGGFVVSYLVFTLGENMKLLRFFIKSGILFFVGSYVAAFFLVGTGPRLSPGVFPPYQAAILAFFFSAVATPTATILYGYYRLFKKRKSRGNNVVRADVFGYAFANPMKGIINYVFSRENNYPLPEDFKDGLMRECVRDTRR